MIAALAADLVSTAPLACVVAGIGTCALSPLGIDFDLAIDLLLHGGPVACPPVNDGSVLFTGVDTALG